MARPTPLPPDSSDNGDGDGDGNSDSNGDEQNHEYDEDHGTGSTRQSKDDPDMTILVEALQSAIDTSNPAIRSAWTQLIQEYTRRVASPSPSASASASASSTSKGNHKITRSLVAMAEPFASWA